jgi:hypothetical protein
MDYMNMTPKDFDQSPEGWRALDEKQRYLEASELILSYIRQNRHDITGMNPSLQVMYFHAGQEYAMAGEKHYENAIECFEYAYMESTKWNLYVEGTIAFLKRDKTTLIQAIAGQAMNSNVLVQFLHALEKSDNSYRENYNPAG